MDTNDNFPCIVVFNKNNIYQNHILLYKNAFLYLITYNQSEPLYYTQFVKSTKDYVFNGVLHRDDGPALIWEGNILEYWLHGVEITSKVQDLMDQGLSDKEALDVCLL